MTTVHRTPRRERPLGSIRYVERRGHFEIRLRDRPGGNQRSTYVAGPDTPEQRLEAERELARRIANPSPLSRPVERGDTVGRWLDAWLEMQGDLRPNTRTTYEARSRLYVKPTLGAVKLRELEPHHIAEAFRKIERMPGVRVERLSTASVAGCHRMLSAALEDAWRLGKIPMNPCRIARVKRPSTRIEPPTQEELDRIFEELRKMHEDPPRRASGGGRHPEAGGAWYAAFLTLRWTGARRGEILGLEWRRVDTAACTIRLSRAARGAELKTPRPRKPIAIPRFVADEIEALPRHIRSPYVFTTSTGAPLDERNLQRRWDEACRRAGVAPSEYADLDKYRIHDMRHAFATLLLEAGVPQSSVSEQLGHSSLDMLNRYAHVEPIPNGDARRRLLAAFPDLYRREASPLEELL